MLTIAQHQVGDSIRLVLEEPDGEAVPLTSATLLQILARPPHGPVRLWPAAVLGDLEDGIITHTLVAGDLDEAGHWQLQPHVVLPGEDLRGSAVELLVVEALDLPAPDPQANLVLHGGDNWTTHAGENLVEH